MDCPKCHKGQLKIKSWRESPEHVVYTWECPYCKNTKQTTEYK